MGLYATSAVVAHGTVGPANAPVDAQAPERTVVAGMRGVVLEDWTCLGRAGRGWTYKRQDNHEHRPQYSCPGQARVETALGVHWRRHSCASLPRAISVGSRWKIK